MEIRGIIPAIGTPLRDGDRVDEPGLRRLAQYLLKAGVNGVFANGSMGGFAFLTDEEQERAVATVAAEVAGKVPVIAGVGDTGTARAVRKARRLAGEGVDALAVLPPFFFFANQQHLVAWFSEIAAAVDLPVFLYDNPALTKCSILPETAAELRRRIPSIAGIKVSHQDCASLQELLWVTREFSGFTVLTGSEFLVLVALEMGCQGSIGGLYNVCPQIVVDLYRAFESGDRERARRRQRELIEAWQIFKYGAIWGAFDEALRWLGIAERATGAPYSTELPDEEKRKVREILERQVRPWLNESAKDASATAG